MSEKTGVQPSEKIKVITEKIAFKKKTLEQKLSSVDRWKNDISKLKKEIAELERDLKNAEAEGIMNVISAHGLTAETVKGAIESGFLDELKESTEGQTDTEVKPAEAETEKPLANLATQTSVALMTTQTAVRKLDKVREMWYNENINYERGEIVRYSDNELMSLMTDLESDKVERKQNINSDVTTKIRQTICAFANDLPNHNKAGVLFVGANDDGSLSNLSITDQLLLQLADMKTDGRILPLPVMTVEKRTLNGGEIAVITVLPSDMPPVKFDGRIWIRNGSRRALANEQEERILIERRRFKNIPYDIRPVHNANIKDLSRAIFEDEFLPSAFANDILEANGRSYEERLSACRMVVSPDEPTPTILGILALGKEPNKFIPCSCVQFLRIYGTKLTDPVIDEEKIVGNLKKIIEGINEKIIAHNRVAVDVTSSSTHRITSDYSLPAIQQILYNAILHRTYENTNAPVRVYWYDNRIEIYSPGGPYGNVTSENFGKIGITDYRNPNIADVMKVFNYIQAFGRGIGIANEECRKIGSPVPKFETNESQVVCTFYNKNFEKNDYIKIAETAELQTQKANLFVLFFKEFYKTALSIPDYVKKECNGSFTPMNFFKIMLRDTASPFSIKNIKKIVECISELLKLGTTFEEIAEKLEAEPSDIKSFCNKYVVI
jgi:ATP-dependent DNA helicase RecG